MWDLHSAGERLVLGQGFGIIPQPLLWVGAMGTRKTQLYRASELAAHEETQVPLFLMPTRDGILNLLGRLVEGGVALDLPHDVFPLAVHAIEPTYAA